MDGKTKQVTRTKLSGPGVYMIRCKANGKVYVGSTVRNVRNRLSTHLGALRYGRHICRRLQADFTQYGESQFECLVIALIPEQDVLQRESYEIANRNATDVRYGYNFHAKPIPPYRKKHLKKT